MGNPSERGLQRQPNSRATAENADVWLEKAMIDGMDEVLNDLEVGGPRVPVVVETEIGKTWAG